MAKPKLDPQLLGKAVEWESLREWWWSRRGYDTSEIRSLIDRHFLRIQSAESANATEGK